MTLKDTDTVKLLENKRSVFLTTLNQNDQNKTIIEVKTSTKDIKGLQEGRPNSTSQQYQNKQLDVTPNNTRFSNPVMLTNVFVITCYFKHLSEAVISSPEK